MIRFVPLVLFAAAAPLTAQQPASTPATIERAADPGDKMICKRFTDTGSLVSSHKVCMTKADWQRKRDEARESVSASNGCADISVGKGGC